VSDVRALLAARPVEIGDGPYLERLDPPLAPVEEFLRGWSTHLAWLRDGRSRAFVKATKSHESLMRGLDDDQLRQTLLATAAFMRRDGFRDKLLARAFAGIREASHRVLGLRHYDVQLLAGRALLNGKIAEMATGEGKTLAATLAACTAAATGAAVHVVTVNDYLSTRDAEENAPLFSFFGLTVGNIKQDHDLSERRVQYACDIVYVSNKELTFDYLKDQISHGGVLHSHRKLRALQGATSHLHTILRGLHVAIVDEADSVLIDEARTPLIISETLPDDLGLETYSQAMDIAQNLEASAHYLRGKDRDIWLTEAGHVKSADLCRSLGGLWASPLWRRELLQKALSALHVFHRDQHYILVDGKVQIVDEFTGRVMPDRTWERGLHQMIEAKEGCEISGQRKTLSQITYQRFFGRYLLLGGMTGTAKEVEPEIKRVYNLSVSRIPTHRLSRRVRLPDRVYRTSEDRWQAVATRVVEVSQLGRAVLVGTHSVEASETLAGLLEERGVPHAVLNARQDKDEAMAVAQAGECARITVATNMAGRGTDIKLAAEVEKLGGLHVILTEFHESARVDRQLFGRSARQGNPGTVEAMVSLEDDIFRRFVPVLVSIWSGCLLQKNLIFTRFFRWVVSYAQSKSERESRKVRLDTIKRDRKWLQALGFVGTTKK
jgi:preprotein translocase subunit SecA